MKNSVRLVVLATVLAIAPHARATAIYALTEANEILVVDADVRQKVLSIRAIANLANGELVMGIDGRPADGQLYGLTSLANFTNPRIHIINPTTGVATLVAALKADPLDATNPFTQLSGKYFAIDFNPQADASQNDRRGEVPPGRISSARAERYNGRPNP